jgi:uncharacterized protein (UPF0264 family)
MTRLLVSIRSADEALAALAGGADLIDVKEPSRGALGAADPETWRAVCDAVAGRVPVSAALGELLDDRRMGFLARRDAGSIEIERSPANDVGRDGVGTPSYEELSFVKAGLAGAANDPDLRERLQSLQRSLPTSTQLVAVAYADAQRANAPSPWQVLDNALTMQLSVLLIDTFDKAHGDLWSALRDDELRELVRVAHQAGLRVALAGSLTLATLPRALALAPDWIAVRGAACEDGRSGEVSTARVRALREAISAAALERAVEA